MASRRRTIVLLLLAFAAAGAGWAAWWHMVGRYYESTDNAYVQADMAQITPRMGGTVTEVLVHENWWVKPGQVLVRLDTRDYEVRLAEAKATLTRARESVDQLFAAVAVGCGEQAIEHVPRQRRALRLSRRRHPALDGARP